MQEDRRVRFEALIDEVGEPLRRYVVRRTGRETAQDVLADAFLVIWRRLDDVPDEAALPWCYAVARNCLHNEQRSVRRQRLLVGRIARTSPTPEVATSPELPDPALHEALARLRPQDRELIALWAWEDLSPADIAVVLGITVNAVNIRLHRARRRLAALLTTPETRKDPGGLGHEHVKEGR